MKICIGSDHGGFKLKADIVAHLKASGHEVNDIGTHEDVACDYPDIAVKVCEKILDKSAERGILICGTGIGISIAANKINGIRCALLSDVFSAKATRDHNDTNIMALGARVIASGLACELVDAFLSTPFSNGPQHVTRIDKIKQLEK